jgi:hypothetical protein
LTSVRNEDHRMRQIACRLKARDTAAQKSLAVKVQKKEMELLIVELKGRLLAVEAENASLCRQNDDLKKNTL